MAIPLKYNLRNLLVRRVTTIMTAVSIALVVATFVLSMALIVGMRSAIRDTGLPDNVIVLRKGVTSESASSLTLAQFDALKFLEQVRRTTRNEPMASPELPVPLLLSRRGGGTDSIIVRGVLPIALAVHDNVHLVAGRMFTPGLNEVIVGKALVGHYRGCSLNGSMSFGREQWKVVGIFDSGGSSFDAEVWADINRLQSDTQRGSYFAAVRLKLIAGADRSALIRRIADDPRINLEAEPETAYYEEQSKIADKIGALGTIIAAVMALGAMFGAMNTMYAAVAARTSDIGILRALGFSRSSVMISFLIESCILAIGAGMVGVILVSPVDAISFEMANSLTFSVIAFNFRVTPAVFGEALMFALIIGMVGGVLPAHQAMKMNVIDALRNG